MTEPTSKDDRMTVERLRGFAEAWRARDVDRLMTYMSDDCEFRASVGVEPGTTFRGRASVRRGFMLVLAYDDDVQVDLGPVFVHGDHGTAQWSYSRPGSAGPEVIGCDIYEFSGGKIRVKDAYRKVRAPLSTASGDKE